MQLTSNDPTAARNDEGPGAALMAAALCLPGLALGLAAPMAAAETPPERATVAVQYADYRDWQPGARRMHVKTPSVFVLTPVGGDYSMAASYTTDSMSGASPLFHDTLSGASGRGVRDFRRAGDVKLTRYFDRVTIGIGAAVSAERDYLSRAANLEARVATEDNNTTFAFGVGGSSDRIDSENGVAQGRRKHTRDWLIGVTQVLTPASLIQVNLTQADGRGYFSDPYKPLDRRPESRHQTALRIKYHHYVAPLDAALRLSYRYYRDSWGVRAHTLETAWEQALAAGWSVTPSLRYNDQSAATFYRNPPFGSGFVFGAPYSGDHRLSAFGAWTAGLKATKVLPDGWSIDAKVEFYRQRGNWRLLGDGSPGLPAFSARTWLLGMQKSF